MQIFSQRMCLLCGVSNEKDVCHACFKDLPQLPTNRCPICLLPVTTSQECGVCLTTKPAFTRALAAFQYSFPIDALIQSLKYQTNLAIVPILADLLIDQIEITKLPDFIVPMPLHPKRLRERGFNQALEISRVIANKSGVTLLSDVCQRIRNTPAQTGLNWKERQKNIHNAFTCSINVSGKHIAVVDDVMTTGATLNELAKVLCQQGADEVSGWIVARTLPAMPPSRTAL